MVDTESGAGRARYRGLSMEGNDRAVVLIGAGGHALVVAETSGDRFSIAVAHEAVGGTMRHMMRLEDAEEHMDRAVDAFRGLGARWELASALTSRGIARRLAGRAEDAVKDLREAYRLCRELKERSIITWTASALARAFVNAGDPGSARRVLDEIDSVANVHTAAGEDWIDYADVEILLAEGEPGMRIALPNARVMVHQPSGGARGMASDIEIQAREIIYARERLNEIMAKHTGQTVARITEDVDRDRFMSPVEAQAYGLIDHVVAHRGEVVAEDVKGNKHER